MGKVESTEGAWRQAIAPRERAEPFDNCSDRRWGGERHIDRVEAQTFGVAREEQYSDAHVRSGSGGHAWKLMEKGPHRARVPGVDPLDADSRTANRAESDALQWLGGGRTLVRNQGA